MEVEPASRTEFEEDNLKQKESDAKDITEINGNNDENDIEIDVKLSDTIKDKAKFNDNDSPPSLSPQENAKQEALDNDLSEKLISQINGNKEDKEDQENDANNSDVKPKDESLKMEEEDEDEVKEEPMDQDLDPDPEPELPAFEDQDRSVKLEEPLFDEKLIDGFSFRAFDKYTVLEVIISVCSDLKTGKSNKFEASVYNFFNKPALQSACEADESIFIGGLQ